MFSGYLFTKFYNSGVIEMIERVTWIITWQKENNMHSWVANWDHELNHSPTKQILLILYFLPGCLHSPSLGVCSLSLVTISWHGAFYRWKLWQLIWMQRRRPWRLISERSSSNWMNCWLWFHSSSTRWCIWGGCSILSEKRHHTEAFQRKIHGSLMGRIVVLCWEFHL